MKLQVYLHACCNLHETGQCTFRYASDTNANSHKQTPKTFLNLSHFDILQLLITYYLLSINEINFIQHKYLKDIIYALEKKFKTKVIFIKFVFQGLD